MENCGSTDGDHDLFEVVDPGEQPRPQPAVFVSAQSGVRRPRQGRICRPSAVHGTAIGINTPRLEQNMCSFLCYRW